MEIVGTVGLAMRSLSQGSLKLNLRAGGSLGVWVFNGDPPPKKGPAI